MKKRLLALLLLAVTALTALSSAYAATPAWRSVVGGNETVLAASEDGARFLLGEAVPCSFAKSPELRLRVLDEATKESRALYFAGDTDFELLARLALKKLNVNEERQAEIMESYGGAAALMMRVGWLSWPVPVGVRGDYLLLGAPAMSGYDDALLERRRPALRANKPQRVRAGDSVFDDM